MVYRTYEGYVTLVDTPLSGPDLDLVRPFAGTYNGVAIHIYIPFDPNTWKIPENTSEFIGKRMGNAYVWFSPNVYKLFISEYVKTDENGNQYFTTFPMLIVDYNTPLGFIYSGPNQPGERPLDMQVEDWKSGYMWGRRELDEDITIQTCVGDTPTIGCIPTEMKLRAGWYWVKHQARLLSVPATLLTGVSDVLVFAYKKPDNIVMKIPGFSSIADYIIKNKLTGDGVEQINELLEPFGYHVDYTQQYVTRSGKVATGPTVEETENEYYVYVPIAQTGSLGPEIGIGGVVAAIIIGLGFAIAVFAILYIQSLKQEAYKLYLASVVEAQENYTRCVSACSAYTDEEERQKCLDGCRSAYETAINTAQQAWQTYNESSAISEVTELVKWGVIALVAVSILKAVKR